MVFSIGNSGFSRFMGANKKLVVAVAPGNGGVKPRGDRQA
jgi:hypothetical protein